jgi:chemotaxis protein MotA
MDQATLIGILTSTAFVLMGILMGGTIDTFINIPSVFITFGGALGALFINFSMPQVFSTIKVVKNTFTTKSINIPEIITSLVGFSEKARREGLLVLEKELSTIDDPFMKKGIQLVIDGAEQEVVKTMLEIEMSFIEDRHALGREILEQLAALTPAWGMIGTIIGLILMLKALDDPSSVGPAMATALLTTFYGAIGAFMFFTPMAGKLKMRSKEEMLAKKVIIEGVLSVQAGDNPRMVEEKLKLFLAPGARDFSALKKD